VPPPTDLAAVAEARVVGAAVADEPHLAVLVDARSGVVVITPYQFTG